MAATGRGAAAAAVRCALVLALALAMLWVSPCAADERTHTYTDNEEVVLWVNKVGPFANPQETYMYYSLPFCSPAKVVESRTEGLGEALQGYELRKSQMPVHFKKDVAGSAVICRKTLNANDAKQFKHAVSNQYWYQMFMDDLPIWGMVGEVLLDNAGKERQLLYTHKQFVIGYNENRIVEVNMTSENPVPIETNADVSFTYSVEWVAAPHIAFEERFNKYLDYNFFEHQIHWFSIFNSFMMVIFLTGLVAMILLRTLTRDLARYAREEDEEDDHDMGDESGWKQVRGDVFRPPKHLALFSALIGTGYQLTLLVVLVVLLSIAGTYYRTRGSLVTVFIVLYALTGFVGGYGSGALHARHGGKNWIATMLLSASLFPAVCMGIGFALNFVAMGYHSLATIPFGTMLALVAILLFVSLPLNVVGTILGRNWSGKGEFPCRTTPVPSPVPERVWYMRPWVNVALGGILPFGSIFIEMYFIFTSFWHYKYYYVYGFMLLVFVILVVVTVCVTIVSTYFLLNSEDYRWQWVSFLSGASTAAYVFAYSVYYFLVKTNMNGFFQTSFYFGYTAMFCVGLGLLTGSVGYFGTSLFVNRIFSSIKVD